METSNEILCPECGALIKTAPLPKNPGRLAAFHNCLGKGERQVFETDNINYSPTDLVDRLHQSENVPIKTTRRK